MNDPAFHTGLDSRIRKWLLMPHVSFFTSISFYILMVKVILPKYMQYRKPFNLQKVLILYNIVQMVVSTYLFYLAVQSWFIHQSASFFKCNSVDWIGMDGTKTASAIYSYFLSKYIEFFETYFFILRKKFNQVSFLHIYHHISTPILTWLVLLYYPGGSFVILMLLNTFVHIVMYTYYLLSAMGPKMQKYLWWKKYITTIQMFQFLTAIFHFAISFFTPNCNISENARLLMIFNAIMLFTLFSLFYKNQYKTVAQLK